LHLEVGLVVVLLLSGAGRLVRKVRLLDEWKRLGWWAVLRLGVLLLEVGVDRLAGGSRGPMLLLLLLLSARPVILVAGVGGRRRRGGGKMRPHRSALQIKHRGGPLRGEASLRRL
jgi:hypothetical protein